MKDIISFTLKLTGLTVLISAIVLLLLKQVPAYNPGTFIWIAVGFFYLLTFFNDSKNIFFKETKYCKLILIQIVNYKLQLFLFKERPK